MAWGFCLLGLWTLQSEEPAKPVDYLVLQNGSVLTGRVYKDGNTFILRSLSSMGESRYPSSLIARHCQSAEEVYAFLKKSIAPGDAR
ncbi:MAG TPA: hypothetical protein PKA06_15340, partial [Gemmatales bacterium]|nr:hypothetical protein [Gemmatales bacterium]